MPGIKGLYALIVANGPNGSMGQMVPKATAISKSLISQYELHMMPVTVPVTQWSVSPMQELSSHWLNILSHC